MQHGHGVPANQIDKSATIIRIEKSATIIQIEKSATKEKMSKLHTAPSDQIAGSSHQAVLQPENGITSLLACSKPANEQNRKENKQS